MAIHGAEFYENTEYMRQTKSPSNFYRAHPHSPYTPLENSSYVYLSGYIENIRVNDPKVTLDFTTTDPTYQFNQTFTTKLELFNLHRHTQFQVVFQDNVRTILPY
jgi:hypothetical protein